MQLVSYQIFVYPLQDHMFEPCWYIFGLLWYCIMGFVFPFLILASKHLQLKVTSDLELFQF